MFKATNPNPSGSYVGDCVVRALSIAMNRSWNETYINLCLMGLMLYDMPSSNRVWHEYLKTEGYKRHPIPDDCPTCYTIKDFCNEYFKGTYIVGTGTHVVAVINGDYLDTWDSGDETPVFYWQKEE